MTFSDTAMMELGITQSTKQHKIIDPYPQVCLGHLADGRSLHGGRI